MARSDPNGYTRIDLAFTREARRWAEFQKDADKAKRFALRKLGRSLPVAWRKDIQKDFNLPAKQLRERITAYIQGDSLVLIGRRRPIGIINFAARWKRSNRRGAPTASAEVRRGRREYVDGGFIAVGLSSNRHVFERTGRMTRNVRGSYAGKRREQIEVVYGPSVVSFFRYVPRQERMYVFAAEVFRKELARVRKFV